MKKFLFFMFLGISIGLLGQHYIQYFVVQKLSPVLIEAEKEGVILSTPKLVLSDFGLPTLGLEVDQVLYSNEHRCFLYDIQAYGVYVPLSWRLLFGDKTIEKIRVASLALKANEISSQCSSSSSIRPKSPLKAKQSASIVSSSRREIASPLAEKIFTPIRKWFSRAPVLLKTSPVKSIDIKSISLQADNQEDKHLKGVGEARLFLREQLIVDLNLRDLILRKGQRAVNSRFVSELRASLDVVSLVGRWNFSEGEFSVSSELKREGESLVHIESTNLPMSLINKWYDSGWSFRYIWLNCKMKADFMNLSWAGEQWEIDHCGLSGPSGKIQLLSKTLTSVQKPKELDLVIEDVDLDKVINAPHLLPYAKVVKKLGVLNGKMSLKSRQWKGQLSLAQAGIIFSNRDKRVMQVVDELMIDGTYSKGDYSFELNKLVLKNGTFSGSIFAEYNKYQKNGKIQVDISSLEFNEDVQDLMTNGRVSDTKIKGRAHLGEDASVTLWKGALHVGSFQHKELSLNGLKSKTEWDKDKELQLDVDVKSLEVASGGEQFSWLFATYADDKMPATIKLAHLSSTGLLKKRRLQWSALQAKLSGDVNGELRSEGSYSAEEGFGGQISWLASGEKTWGFTRQNGSMIWSPQSEKLRIWLKKNVDHTKKYPEFRIEEAAQPES